MTKGAEIGFIQSLLPLIFLQTLVPRPFCQFLLFKN